MNLWNPRDLLGALADVALAAARREVSRLVLAEIRARRRPPAPEQLDADAARRRYPRLFNVPARPARRAS